MADHLADFHARGPLDWRRNPVTTVRIALVGDYHPKVTAHQAIPQALALAGETLGLVVEHRWMPTDAIFTGPPTQFDEFDGTWCVPASPYKSEAGALRAIRASREDRRPFLGTCGGFQHALLEYARHVAGIPDAAHAENDPAASVPVVAPLACSLVEATGLVTLEPGTRVARAYGESPARETYHCRYGLNPHYASILLGGALRVTGRDADGEVRAIELEGHPFFIATLFQPERAALHGRPHPLINAFVAAAAA
jgi:CTP synthase (UTP-ammonia lyase)